MSWTEENRPVRMNKSPAEEKNLKVEEPKNTHVAKT